MLILTDFLKFPKQWQALDTQGEASTALAGASVRDVLKLIPEIRRADLLLLHESLFNVLWIVLLFWVFPFLKKPIVVVDLILRKPNTPKEKMMARIKRILLKRVDHFIHYFRTWDGYEKYYGISPKRCSYVAFKSNLFGEAKVAEWVTKERDEYIFSAGWSFRDYDTFFEAISRLEYPAAIPRPNFDQLQRHGARFTWKLEKLPKNLVILEDNGTSDSWIRNLCKARIVVIPMLRDTLRATGISVYLDAMLLKKCVIISAGPGVSNVLTNQAIIVAPEDPAALAAAIGKVWDDPAFRSEVALRGYQYASSLGGEPELMNRILERVVSWYGQDKKK